MGLSCAQQKGDPEESRQSAAWRQFQDSTEKLPRREALCRTEVCGGVLSPLSRQEKDRVRGSPRTCNYKPFDATVGMSRRESMYISTKIRLKSIVNTCVLAASYANAFPKLCDASPVPGASSQGVALGASPRLIAAVLPKTGAAKAGSSVTGSTQQHDKSRLPAKG